jgi:hypothetical protein
VRIRRRVGRRIEKEREGEMVGMKSCGIERKWRGE